MYDIIGYDAAGRPIPVPGIEPNARVMGPEGALVGRLQVASGDTVALAAAAGATGTLTCKVQAPFRPEFVILQSSNGASSTVKVTGIRVGTREQSIGQTSAIPIQAFTPNNLLGKLQLDTAAPGVDITISLENGSAQADTVSFVLYGTRLDRA